MTLPAPGSTAALHLEAIYRIEGGRIAARHDEGASSSPRFHLFRTPAANYWLLSAALPDSLFAKMEAALAAEPVVDDPEHAPPDFAAVRAILDSERPATNEYRGPAFTFPDEIPSPGSEAIRFVTKATDPGIGGELSWLADEVDDVQPAAAIVVDGQIASLCCSVPGDRAVEASLRTVEAYRGRGYAAAVTAAWARAVRDAGRTPLYSTSWDNHASRSVARKLGLRFYGEDWHID